MVFLVNLEMPGEVLDFRGEECDLHFRRSGVVFALLKIPDDFLRLFLVQHILSVFGFSRISGGLKHPRSRVPVIRFGGGRHFSLRTGLFQPGAVPLLCFKLLCFKLL